MFDNLDSIPWRDLHHAYGLALDAPKWIRALDSEDENDRKEAINEFLWSCACHQYTLYPATSFVIPFVIEALESPTLAERADGMGNPMKRELLHFIRCCAYSGQRAVVEWEGWPSFERPTVEEVTVAGRPIYEKYANDANDKVRADAAWLLNFCDSQTKSTTCE